MRERRSKADELMLYHTDRAQQAWVAEDGALLSAVTAHVERYFGPVTEVLHDEFPVHAHIDLLVVEPNEKCPGITVATAGMSGRPMNGDDAYAELMMILPPSMPREAWPYRVIRDLARLPHEFDTLLWLGHTIPNGDPARPYARDTKLCGAVIAPQMISEDAQSFEHDGHEVAQFTFWPLHAAEMRVKLDRGMDAFWEMADEARLIECIDPQRPDAAPKRRGRFFRR
jgi:hypothetical protein